MKRRPNRTVQVFKAEGREGIKRKSGLLEGRCYLVPSVLELTKEMMGCVGRVNPGTVVRLATVRKSRFGTSYFFDGFRREGRKLVWIGEFDVMNLEMVAAQLGEEVTDYDELSIPDARGVFSDVLKDAITSITTQKGLPGDA